MSIEDFPMDQTLDAEITVRLRLSNLCTREDLAELEMSFEDLVRQEIRENGLFGLVDDEGVVTEIKVWQS